MSLKDKFDECFKAEFPATFEAAKRGEPQPHGDFSNAWWGFKTGYRCALPTTEPAPPKAKVSFLPILMFGAALIGAVAGYKFPRDVEIESTKPIAITYEVTPEAARYLVLKAVKGMESE